jgi:hypothetical protein
MKSASSARQLLISSVQGSKFALRIRRIAKNCECEANSLRFASQKMISRSLRFRFAFWTLEFAELRKNSQNPRKKLSQISSKKSNFNLFLTVYPAVFSKEIILKCQIKDMRTQFWFSLSHKVWRDFQDFKGNSARFR